MQWQQESRPGVFTSLVALFDGGRGTLLTLLLAPLLSALALWLPPLSVGERVFDAGYTPVPREGATFADPDGTRLTLPAEALPAEGRVKVQFVSASRQSFIEGTAGGVLEDAPAALPPSLIIKSPVYVADVRGARPAYSLWAIPIPNDSEPYSLLDLYAWDGSGWRWLPHTLRLTDESEEIATEVAGVPLGVAVMQAQRVPPQVGAVTDENADFVNQAGGTVDVLSPRLYLVQGDGSIGQIFTPSPIFQQSGALVAPVLHNVEPSGVVRSDLVDNLLIDPNAWRVHVDRIETLVLGSNFDGIVIDYRQVDPLLRNEFSQFVLALGERLAASGKLLGVRVDAPVRVAADQFDTGAYDWPLIGQAATMVRVPVPLTAGLYAGADDLEALLAHATGQINRYRIELELPAAPYEVVAGQALPVPYDEVAAQLAGDGAGATPLPLDALVAEGRLTREPSTGNYRLTLDNRELFLEDAATLAERLARIEAYHLGGIVLLHANQADPQVWDVVARYRSGALP